MSGKTIDALRKTDSKDEEKKTSKNSGFIANFRLNYVWHKHEYFNHKIPEHILTSLKN